MLDHLGLTVSDYAKSRRFYESALAPLGYGVIMEFDGAVAGLGASGKPDFWIAQGEGGNRVHVAFASPDRATVDAFYKAAIAAGGIDNGGPGLRPEYHPNYYGAFVFDPDGNNIEAVCHTAES
jgi:catechol 2,3-dioxygenase-like lactoylglutathione lyase family enzyme